MDLHSEFCVHVHAHTVPLPQLVHSVCIVAGFGHLLRSQSHAAVQLAPGAPALVHELPLLLELALLALLLELAAPAQW